MTAMLRYDEKSMIDRLRAMEARGRSAFAAACAQRLLPSYRAFSGQSGAGNPSMLTESLSMLWDRLRGGAIEKDDLIARIEVCEQIVPEEDEQWSELTAYAQNAAAAVAYALRCEANGEPQEAAWAARQAYEAVDFYVVHKNGVDVNAPDAELKILSHPVVQAELGRQDRDLREGEHLAAAELLRYAELLRERSEREAISFAE